MAVTNFHYITRMSSGFKVYILEGNYNFVPRGLINVFTSSLDFLLAASVFDKCLSVLRDGILTQCNTEMTRKLEIYE